MNGRSSVRAFDSTLGEMPTIFCLHNLGGSAREWTRVAAVLERVRCVAIDLPGFGDAASEPGYSVAEMARSVARTIAADAPKRWLLAGHSMSAKVVAAIARGAEDGDRDLAGLVGLVLVAGSPPSPEPIPDEQRRRMLGYFRGDAAGDRADAERYVAENSVALDASAADEAIADALRADRSAWRAWFESGSREDWSERVGVLRLPTLIIAGTRDENLGPDAQRSLTAPHYANVRSLTLPNAKHLLPLECPREVARAIDEHVAYCAYRALMETGRVSSRTRDILLERGKPDDPHYRPAALDAEAFATLRAVLDRVVPQDGAEPIDLAARLDRQLAAGGGDGWRFAILPPDIDAFRSALRTIADASLRRSGAAFAEFDGDARDEMLARIADGSFEGGRLSGEQMRAWFEDLRAEAAKAYVAHPQTLARMGYAGIANGGDGEPKSGFALIGPGEREPWEPVGTRERPQ